MPTINNLPLAASISSGDQLPLFVGSEGGTFKTSIDALTTYLESTLKLINNLNAALYTQQSVTSVIFSDDTNFFTTTGYATVGDASPAHYMKLPGPPLLTQPWYLQTADGAWWQLICGTTIDPRWFGANTSLVDNTAAFNNAIAFASFLGGGEIFVPAQTFTFTGTLKITASNISIIGANRFGSYLNFNNGVLDCITVQGASLANTVGAFTLANLTINGNAKTGGRALLLAFCYRSVLRDLNIQNSYTGFEIFANNDTFLENIIFQGIPGGAGTNFFAMGPTNQKPTACYGIFWHGGIDNTTDCLQLTTFNVTVSAGYSGADGFIWDGNANTWNMDQVTALNTRYGLWVKNSALSASYFPEFLVAHNFNTDGMILAGIRIDGGSTFAFTNSFITNTSGSPGQGSQDTQALIVNADATASYTRELYFSNCRIGQSLAGAAYIAGRDIQFSNCTFVSGSTTPSGTYPGLHIAAPAIGVMVSNCKFSIFGDPNNFQYAIQVDAGTAAILLIGQDVYSTSGLGVNWQNTDASSRNLIVSGAASSVDLTYFTIPNTDTVTASYNIAASKIIGGIYYAVGTPGAAFTASLPTAAAIVAALLTPGIGSSFQLLIGNSTGQTLTFSASAGIGFAGSATLAAGASRMFTVRINNPTLGSESVSFYG